MDLNFEDCFISFRSLLCNYFSDRYAGSNGDIFLKIAKTTNADFCIERRQLTGVCIDLIALKLQSSSWPLKIKNVELTEKFIILNLDREHTITHCLCAIFCQSEDTYGYTSQYESDKLIVDFHPKKENDLSSFRLKTLARAVTILCQSVGYNICSKNTNSAIKLCLRNNHYSINRDENHVSALCSTVINSSTKCKENSVTVLQYKRIMERQILNDDSTPNNIAEKLVNDSMAFSMLSIKPTSAVCINFLNLKSNNSSAVLFILYNYTRLSALLSKFEDRVKDGYYSSLPPVLNVDFIAINSEKEWRLTLQYIIQFPSVVLKTVQDLKQGRLYVHHLCKYLYDLSSEFSSYYRSTKILLDNQPHLMSTLFARIYFIKAIKLIIKNGLKAIGIEPYVLSESTK